MEPLEIRVEPDQIDPEISHDLDSLAAQWRQAGVEGTIQEERIPSGGKDGGLTAAIAVSTLVLTAVGTLVGVLNFWLSTRPKYTAKLTLNGVEFTIESHDVDDLKAKLINAQASSPGARKVLIELRKR